MNDTSSKSREFWVIHGEVYDCEQDLGVLRGDQFHVVEHSALVAAQAEIEQLKHDFEQAKKTALAHSKELTYRGTRIDELEAERAHEVTKSSEAE